MVLKRVSVLSSEIFFMIEVIDGTGIREFSIYRHGHIGCTL
jgi:hypothetical protein